MAVENLRFKRWYQYSTTAGLLYDRGVVVIAVDKNVQTYRLLLQKQLVKLFMAFLVWPASRAVRRRRGGSAPLGPKDYCCSETANVTISTAWQQMIDHRTFCIFHLSLARCSTGYTTTAATTEHPFKTHKPKITLNSLCISDDNAMSIFCRPEKRLAKNNPINNRSVGTIMPATGFAHLQREGQRALFKR